jgi:hypothetical protein
MYADRLNAAIRTVDVKAAELASLHLSNALCLLKILRLELLTQLPDILQRKQSGFTVPPIDADE